MKQNESNIVECHEMPCYHLLPAESEELGVCSDIKMITCLVRAVVSNRIFDIDELYPEGSLAKPAQIPIPNERYWLEPHR